MKYKNILVHLDNSSGCRNRLEVAFGMAREFEGQLLGLFVVPTYIVPSYVEAQISVDLINDVTDKRWSGHAIPLPATRSWPKTPV